MTALPRDRSVTEFLSQLGATPKTASGLSAD